MNIDYNENISKHFTYHEALWLPQWNRHGAERDGLSLSVLDSLQRLTATVDQVRDFYNIPIVVHCMWRPKAYNSLISGAPSSNHMAFTPGVAAIDLHFLGVPCSEMIARILKDGLLDSLNLRMENNGPDPAWIHLDNAPLKVGHERYFHP